MRLIGGEWGGRIIKTGEGPGYRPAMGKVRKALFSMLESRGVHWPEVRVLDLFAGSGSLALEALSRGAAFALLVETGPEAVKVIWENAELLNIAPGRLNVAAQPVSRYLSRPAAGQGYDVVFVDPPYADKVVEQTLQLLLKNAWLNEGAVVAAEVEARSCFAPGRLPERLSLDTDRNYGQTRILLWRMKTASA